TATARCLTPLPRSALRHSIVRASIAVFRQADTLPEAAFEDLINQARGLWGTVADVLAADVQHTSGRPEVTWAIFTCSGE
ncbi:hypothetical protein ACFW92_39610, partial [Streptomyces scopuliridis]